MSRHYDPLEFKRYLYLGGRISQKHEFFKSISKLGFDEAQEYAIIEFWKWFKKQKRAKMERIVQKYLEYVGMANFLRATKELTRLSMILGDTTEIETYE